MEVKREAIQTSVSVIADTGFNPCFDGSEARAETGIPTRP